MSDKIEKTTSSEKFTASNYVKAAYFLLILGTVGSVFYYYSLQSFAKGSYYLVFLSIGVLACHYFKTNLEGIDRKTAVKKIFAVARFAYTPIVVVSLALVTVVFVVLPYGSLYSVVQTRELALYSIGLLSNILVSAADTSYGLVPYPIYQNPLGQTWVFSLIFQVIAATLVVYFIFSYFFKKNSMQKAVILLTLLSFSYFVYSYSDSGVASYSEIFYRSVMPLNLYWIFGAGALVYLYSLERTSLPRKRNLRLAAVLLTGVVVGVVLYNFNYLNLSYTVFILILYILVLWVFNFIITKINPAQSKYQKNYILFNIFKYIKTRFYFIFMVTFPILAYASGITENYSMVTYLILFSLLIALGEFLYVVSNAAYQNKTLNTSYLKSALYLISIFTGSVIVIIFGYTNNILLKTQPNSWLNSIIFSETCNTGRLDKNSLEYLNVQEREADFSCQFNSGEGEPKGRVLILGDSLAVSLVDGIVEGAAAAGWDVDSYASPNCGLGMPSEFGEDPLLTEESAAVCSELYSKATVGLENGHYDAVIVSDGGARTGKWERYLNFKDYVVELGVPFLQVDVFTANDFYSGKNSALVNPWPKTRYTDIKIPTGAQAVALKQRITENSVILDLREKMCTPADPEGNIKCATAVDGVELFADRTHLSRAGSLLVSDLVTDALKSISEE